MGDVMKKTVGVMFPGYGEQFVGMGKNIYNESRLVQDLFEQASMCLDINFVQLCFAASDAEISTIDKGYLSILLLETAIYAELAQAGLRPDFIAGYGIGEYAALVASGSLSFSDSIYILSKYAQMYQEFIVEHPDYSVLILSRGFTLETLTELCKHYSTEDKKVFIAAHNTDEGFMIAGHVDLISSIKEYCKEHEIRKVKEVSVAYGLQSSIIDSVVQRLAPYFFKIDFKPLKTPVITNVDGVYVTSADALESATIRRINEPLQWNEVMNGFVGCDILVSVGPGKQLAQWAQLKYPEKEIYTIEDLHDLENFKLVLNQMNESLESDLVIDDQAIRIGACHVDDEPLLDLPADLTTADLINELPGDYDIDEDEDVK